MHPFCCVSAISDHSSPVKPSATAGPLAGLTMPPFPSPAVLTSDLVAQPAGHGHNNHGVSSSGDSSRRSQQQQQLEQHQLPVVSTAVDLRINDLVGNRISGILQKWVNYGKGWRPRWFVLQDGVVSYYKIHGPDKILINSETEKGSKVIGDESMRIISRSRNSNHHHFNHRRKPYGEIHLKVSTIRQSRSDDKRFSIFTGTKRLYLRAETHEDRVTWMEALQAVKDMFPRMSNSDLMSQVDNVAISTEKLRHRLLQEGVSEAAIKDSEQIMRDEYAALQNQLLLLKQKQLALVDNLRQLEVQLKKSRKHHAN